MRTKQLRISFSLIVLFIVCAVALTGGFLPSAVAYAANTYDVTEFDRGDVLSDLEGSSIMGVPFDINDYPYESGKDPRVLNVVEYCYTPYVNTRGNYGLYVYVYNPSGVELISKDGLNKIQMSVDESGYSLYGLKLLSASSGDYTNLFYKFKVIDPSDVAGKRICDRVNSNSRRYSVSGIMLGTADEGTVSREYAVGLTYTYSGYAAGCGADKDAGSTLKCEFESQKTIALEVKHTSYKAGYSGNRFTGYQTDVNSVYFSIDNDILENYGELVGIKATWYQYLTPYILVIDDWDLYQDLSYVSGVVVSKSVMDSAFDSNYVPLWQELQDKGYTDIPTAYIGRFWAYLAASSTPTPSGERILAPFVYYSDSVVDSDTLLNDLTSYDKTYMNGVVTVNGQQYSADVLQSGSLPNLVLGKVDFESGEVVKEVSATDLESVSLIDLNIEDESFLNTFWGCEQGEEIKDILPIEELTDGKLASSNAADDLLIDSSYIDQVRADVKKADEADKTTFLYRFAFSPYITGGMPSITGDTGGYMAKQAVFLDFKIIHLRFEKKGVETILPVVMDPVDITGDVEEPPVPSYDFWESLLSGFGSIGDFFKDAWDVIKYVFIGIAGALVVAVVVFIVIKTIGLFKRGSKTKIKLELPQPKDHAEILSKAEVKEAASIQYARKKKPAKTVPRTKRK